VNPPVVAIGWGLVFVGWGIFTYAVFGTTKSTGRRRRALVLTLLVLGLAGLINFAPVVVPD
jgi:hypothetical protein